MGFDVFVIQLVCLSCLFLVLRATVIPRGWVILAVAILLVTIATFFLIPTYTAWIAGGIWLVLVLIPLLGIGQINRLVVAERFRQASYLAKGLRWLHPMDGMVEYPHLLQALDLGKQGNMVDAFNIFRQHATATTASGRMATMMLYRMGAEWQQTLEWIRQHLTAQTIFKDSSVGVMYLRSLGETGDLNGLLYELERFERELEKAGDSFTISLCRMFALAFCGQVDRVQAAFEGALAVYPRQAQQFWLATAELAGGNEAARHTLRQLRDRADVTLKNAIDWRLTQPPIHLNNLLSDSSRKILFRLRTEAEPQPVANFKESLRGHKTYGVYALILLNLVMFGVQVKLGNPDDPFETLDLLGALIPEKVLAGEWWRCLTANFLHINLLHLLANMLGLFVFGRFVESTLGTAKFLAVCFISGVGAMLVVTGQALLMDSPGIFCVGASGAVMGLVGVMGAIFLYKWRREKVRFAARQLRWILLLVVLQLMSDLLNPEVSLVGHASGFILGACSGYLLLSVQSPLRPRLQR